MQTNKITFRTHLTRLQRQAVCMLAVVILLVSQAAALQHHHSGNLKLQSNCDLCLHAGSSGSAIPVKAGTFDVRFISPPCACFLPLLFGKSTITPMARAPPHLLS